MPCPMNFIDRCVGETLDRRDVKIAELTAANAMLTRLCCGGALASLVLIGGAYFLGKAASNTEAVAETSGRGELQAQRTPTWREQERNLYEDHDH